MTKSNLNWAIIAFLVLAFGAAGSAKLIGVEEMHNSFRVLGLPEWFGYFIGASEVAGAIGLLVRKLSAAAGAGLAIIAISAVGYHVAYDPLTAAIPALTLGVLSFVIVFARKADSI